LRRAHSAEKTFFDKGSLAPEPQITVGTSQEESTDEWGKRGGGFLHIDDSTRGRNGDQEVRGGNVRKEEQGREREDIRGVGQSGGDWVAGKERCMERKGKEALRWAGEVRGRGDNGETNGGRERRW